MSRRTKNESNNSETSDSDDDDFLFNQPNLLKRKSGNANRVDAKKKKQREQMKVMLQRADENQERENRMDEIQKRESVLLQAEGNEDCLGATKNKSENNDNASSLSSRTSGGGKENDTSSPQNKIDILDHNYCQRHENSKESQPFGCRNTLKYSQFISPGTDGTVPYWSNLEEGRTDLQMILKKDQQQVSAIRDNNASSLSSINIFLDLFLQKIVTASTGDFSEYLKHGNLHKYIKQERIRYLPVDMLRWLVTLACGPTLMASDVSNRSRNEKDTTTVDAIVLQLEDARFGAYNTLFNLWSQDRGYPLQVNNHGDCSLFTVSYLSHFLREWFGLTLPRNSTRKDTYLNSRTNNSEVCKTETTNQMQIRTTPTALIRFLRLWALALQQHNSTNHKEESVCLIRYDHRNHSNDVADAILAVLWAGLDPIFSSSKSSLGSLKGNSYIQVIVECLLDMIRFQDSPNSTHQDYEQWLENLAEKICDLWSTRLGCGQRGTDAYADHEAWLSLSHTVSQTLDRQLENDEGLHSSRPHGSLQSLQLKLSHSIMKKAFPDDNSQNLNHSFGNNTDRWVSELIGDEKEISKSLFQSWQVMALASIGFGKLEAFFPDNDGPKCFSLVEVCSVCFKISAASLQSKIKRLRPKGNVEIDLDGTTINGSRNDEDGHVESNALFSNFEQLEKIGGCLSQKTRGCIMQSVCYSLASHMTESMRNYVRLQKGQFVSQFDNNGGKKSQRKINSYFAK